MPHEDDAKGLARMEKLCDPLEKMFNGSSYSTEEMDGASPGLLAWEKLWGGHNIEYNSGEGAIRAAEGLIETLI